METVDRENHPIEGNPCEQAERAINAIKGNHQSVLNANDQQSSRIKCLIIFPDGYEFEGPKDFSILDRDEVVTLNLRNFRDLPEAILQPTQHKTLDSRKYRKWIEGAVLKSNDDSIRGTWLDPAFDKPEAEPPKGQLWRLRRPRHEELAEQEEVSSSDSSRTKLIQTKFDRRKLKLTITVITATIIGMVGWWLYDVKRPPLSVSYAPRPALSPHPENPTNATKVIQASMPQHSASLSENEKRDILPARGTTKPDEAREPELTGKKRPIESAAKPRARPQASEDSELRRQKIELQIRQAIVLRAITGVTVSFVGDTAYLRGQVESENQRSAAEKAARSVPGIKEIRNSIEVNRLLPADG
ncbi:MAG: BON domain-containing protein [Deltaproteobacteria bacterium]|nr:MAG: BON domain-containing protein [Deltaproteobacteria bacterium]